MVDSSNKGEGIEEDRDFQIDVTNSVLRQLGVGGTETIMVYNKMDIASDRPMDTGGNRAVYTSAKTGSGMDELAEEIRKTLFGDMVKGALLIPYDKGSIVSYLCDNAQIDSIDYREEGTLLRGSFKAEDFGRYRGYSLKEPEEIS